MTSSSGFNNGGSDSTQPAAVVAWCSNCRILLPDDAQFCSKCGTRGQLLRPDRSDPGFSAPQNPVPTAQPSPAPPPAPVPQPAPVPSQNISVPALLRVYIHGLPSSVSLKPLVIEVDGAKVSSIPYVNGLGITLRIEPGRHQILVKNLWRNHKYQVDIPNGGPFRMTLQYSALTGSFSNPRGVQLDS